MSVAEVNVGQADPWVPEDTFGSRLALVRQHMGWNVKQAADECGLGVGSWRNWEAGRSPRGIQEIARQISDRTGVNYVWLLAGDASGVRSRWFSTLAEVSAPDGQMELAFLDGVPVLELVP